MMEKNRTGHHRIQETMGERVFYAVVILLLVLVTLIVLYPLIYIVSVSFSDPYAVMARKVWLLPVNVNTVGYQRVFADPDIWRSYGNTIFYTVTYTLLAVALTAMGAYPLSRQDFYGRNFWSIFFAITMFFGGGMIPAFLWMKQLHLVDTAWAIILIGSCSAWNMIIMRTFFQSSIPSSLQEAAIIDGANDLYIFTKIVIPLSTPVIAVMVLFYGVGQWNSFFTALIYLNDRAKYPLQMILREILINNQLSATMSENISSGAEQEYIGESIKYATIIVATVPILCVYPFLQKYFVKGVMVGAIKG